MSKLDEIIDLAALDAPLAIKIGGTTSSRARRLLRQRLDVVDCDRLQLDLRFLPQSGALPPQVHVAGTVSCLVTQSCVLSGEPMTSELSAKLALDVVLAEDPSFDSPMEMRELGEGDDPEYLPSGQLPLADLVVDALLLELDPYPRLPGADSEQQLPDGVELNAAPQKRENPFAALSALKPAARN